MAVMLPQDADPTVEARTTAGRVESHLPLDIEPYAEGHVGRRSGTSVQRVTVSNEMGDVLILVAGKPLPASAKRLPEPFVEAVDKRESENEMSFLPGKTVTIKDVQGHIEVRGWDQALLWAEGSSAPLIRRTARGAEVVQVLRDGPDRGDRATDQPFGVRAPFETNLVITGGGGNMVIDSVTGGLTVGNSGGDIKIINLKPVWHERSIQCTDGSISILIPPGSDVTISATAEDGSVTSSLPLEKVVDGATTTCRGSVGTGRARVELRTTRGNIAIN
jgi:hypothetical protein